jgi:histidyl-tRNA synthetase
MFRYERPQLGRQRQFSQVGAEVYGLAGPAVEAELILLSARLWRELGIAEAMQLEVNTLGDADDRARFRDTLVGYFDRHRNQLDEDSLRRLERNPLRILDSKNPAMQALIEAAPALRDSLSDASRAHFEQLQELLAVSGIDVVVNPRLVRGLDYYSHTVFEWTTDKLGAQSAVCAGGRYDGLLAELGARDMPGVGWAFGMERVVALMEALGVSPPAETPDIFVMGTDEVATADALALAETIRELLPACSVLHNTAAGSLKSQFRKADKSGAAIAVILGSDELANGQVTIKSLRGTTDGTAEQSTIARAQLAQTLQGLLGH